MVKGRVRRQGMTQPSVLPMSKIAKTLLAWTTRAAIQADNKMPTRTQQDPVRCLASLHSPSFCLRLFLTAAKERCTVLLHFA
jgi:hypothetical protein